LMNFIHICENGVVILSVGILNSLAELGEQPREHHGLSLIFLGDYAVREFDHYSLVCVKTIGKIALGNQIHIHPKASIGRAKG